MQVQILHDSVCVSLYANALGKNMNPSVLPPPSYGLIVGWTDFFSLAKATSSEEGKL